VQESRNEPARPSITNATASRREKKISVPSCLPAFLTFLNQLFGSGGSQLETPSRVELSSAA
jgi:hypothetical protein